MYLSNNVNQTYWNVCYYVINFVIHLAVDMSGFEVVVVVRTNLPEAEEKELGRKELDLREASRVTGKIRTSGDTPGLKGLEGKVPFLLLFLLSFSLFCNLVFALKYLRPHHWNLRASIHPLSYPLFL